MSYSTHSKDYLARARQTLNEGSPESLFYAAFELRCGIEARLQQYEEALASITKIRRAGWRIPKVAGNIEKAFRTGDKIARVSVCEDGTENIIYSFYYTPVNKDLRAAAGKIGELLHFPQEYRIPEDLWWDEARNFLEQVYKELLRANKGTLLCVPLWNPDTRKAHFQTEINSDGDIREQMTVGESYLITVDYLDDLPEFE